MRQYQIDYLIIKKRLGENPRAKEIQEIKSVCDDEQRWSELENQEFEVFGRFKEVERLNEYDGCCSEYCNGKAKFCIWGPKQFKCKRCGKYFDEPFRKLVLILVLQDKKSEMKVKMFNQQAEKFLNVSGDELQYFSKKEKKNLEKRRIEKCLCQYFKLKAQKYDFYQKVELELVVESFEI